VKKDAPTFKASSELARYVSPANRFSGKRIAYAAFLPDPPSENPSNDHLSVNSLELESMSAIAAYYRSRLQYGSGPVAIAACKVFKFNEAGKKCGVAISYDKPSSRWKFGSKSNPQDAYRHRAVETPPPKSPSHCGVEFTRALKAHKYEQFARLMSKARFHLET
jgi:hypothetical protein